LDTFVDMIDVDEIVAEAVVVGSTGSVGRAPILEGLETAESAESAGSDVKVVEKLERDVIPKVDETGDDD